MMNATISLYDTVRLGSAWVSGVFFDMGLERKLFERKNRSPETKDRNDGAPHPLPMLEIELGDSAEKPSESRLDIEARANEHQVAIGVIFRRRDVGSTIPSGDPNFDISEKAQSIAPIVMSTP
jgi:hypothetical protein